MTFSTRREAFRVDSYASGLDHQRTQFVTAYGDYVAKPAETFTAGMLVALDSSGYIIKCVGTNPLGVVKYNKKTTRYASVVGEYVQMNGTTLTTLAHANLFDNGATISIHVSDTLNGTAYALTDFTPNYVNGTIVRVMPAGTIPDGGYVYVNYMYEMTAAQVQYDGSNFWNKEDDVTIQGGKVTVISGDATVYTTAYDPSVTWAINGAVLAGTTGNGKAGLFTVGGGGAAVGTVCQVPTPDDPYLGVRISL